MFSQISCFHYCKGVVDKREQNVNNHYEALKLIKAIGLNCDSIHACTNNCILFGDMLEGSQVCPKCNSNKFMDGSRGVSWKVLHHFPLISRLLQMYRCKTLANLLIWNKCGASSNGLVQSVLTPRVRNTSMKNGQKLLVSHETLDTTSHAWWH